MICFKLFQSNLLFGVKHFHAGLSHSKFKIFSSQALKSRFYAHQNLQEVKPMVVVKKRQVRRSKDLIAGQTLKKSGFKKVTAIATAEEYDLDSMLKAFTQDEEYQPSSFFLEIKDIQLNFLHVVSKEKIEEENKELFVFREGSVVAWNVCDEEVDNIITFVNNYGLNPYNSSIVRDEIEIMPYMYSYNNKNSALQNGNICLTPEANKCSLDKYTLSNGMILSVKLGIWETLLDQYIESLAPLTLNLKKGEKISISRKAVLRKSGELFALKHSINLSSDLLDIPDFYWEREELEKLYVCTCRYFSIPRRAKVINEKLNHCIEIVDLLSSHLSDRHHIRLEWMIIALITIEVCFEIMHY